MGYILTDILRLLLMSIHISMRPARLQVNTVQLRVRSEIVHQLQTGSFTDRVPTDVRCWRNVLQASRHMKQNRFRPCEQQKCLDFIEGRTEHVTLESLQ